MASAYKTIKNLKNSATDYRVSTVVGAWVFYFLLAAVPLAFLLISAFNLFGIDLSSLFAARFPEEFKDAVIAIFLTAKKVSGGITLFFAFTVLSSTYALINQMAKDGEFIYGVKRKPKKKIPSAVFGFAFLTMLFFVFLFAAAIFAFLGYVLFPFGTAHAGRGLKLIFLSCLLIISCFAILILLNRFICPFKIKIASLMAGSLVSLFIMVFGTIGFIVYVRFFGTYNAFYGSLAAIVVFLIWVYILMLGICVGPIFISKSLKSAKKDISA